MPGLVDLSQYRQAHNVTALKKIELDPLFKPIAISQSIGSKISHFSISFQVSYALQVPLQPTTTIHVCSCSVVAPQHTVVPFVVSAVALPTILHYM